MSQKSNAARTLVTAALIAAAYAALTYVSAAMGLAYGEVQFRLSEALCVLAAFTPAAIPGLTIGCVLGNITSPLGIADIVFGAAATLLSAVAVRVIAKYCGKATPFLSVLPPTVINAVIVGAEIVYLTSPEGSLSAALFLGDRVQRCGRRAGCYGSTRHPVLLLRGKNSAQNFRLMPRFLYS